MSSVFNYVNQVRLSFNLVCIRHYPHSGRSVFDTYLSVFVIKAIRICICIRIYPCSYPNLIENVKTNIILVISVRIRSLIAGTVVATASADLQPTEHEHDAKSHSRRRGGQRRIPIRQSLDALVNRARMRAEMPSATRFSQYRGRDR